MASGDMAWHNKHICRLHLLVERHPFIDTAARLIKLDCSSLLFVSSMPAITLYCRNLCHPVAQQLESLVEQYNPDYDRKLKQRSKEVWGPKFVKGTQCRDVAVCKCVGIETGKALFSCLPSSMSAVNSSLWTPTRRTGCVKYWSRCMCPSHCEVMLKQQ